MSLPDSNCVKMLDLGVVPHILNLLERHVDQGDVSIQHAGLSALRNLAIPGALKPSVSSDTLTFQLRPFLFVYCVY